MLLTPCVGSGEHCISLCSSCNTWEPFGLLRERSGSITLGVLLCSPHRGREIGRAHV